MKKLSKLAASAGFLVLMGASSVALASPTGAYVDVMGGADYLLGSELSNLNINPVNGVSNPQYDKSGLGYSGRAAFGYFFNNDPLSSWAYGFELGYNYLSPVKSTQTNQYRDLASNLITKKGTTTTNAWATDADFVVSEDISQSVSLLYKLGVGYESMQQKFSSQVVSGPGAADPSTTTKKDGIGLVGGLGMQYNFSKNFALRAELDGMKGGKGIGYAQGLLGLVWSF